jgi:hypothetical protein
MSTCISKHGEYGSHTLGEGEDLRGIFAAAAAAVSGEQAQPASCGMGCEAGVNVQCVEHGPKWPAAQRPAGQSDDFGFGLAPGSRP